MLGYFTLISKDQADQNQNQNSDETSQNQKQTNKTSLSTTGISVIGAILATIVIDKENKENEAENKIIKKINKIKEKVIQYHINHNNFTDDFYNVVFENFMEIFKLSTKPIPHINKILTNIQINNIKNTQNKFNNMQIIKDDALELNDTIKKEYKAIELNIRKYENTKHKKFENNIYSHLSQWVNVEKIVRKPQTPADEHRQIIELIRVINNTEGDIAAVRDIINDIVLNYKYKKSQETPYISQLYQTLKTKYNEFEKIYGEVSVMRYTISYNDKESENQTLLSKESENQTLLSKESENQILLSKFQNKIHFMNDVGKDIPKSTVMETEDQHGNKYQDISELDQLNDIKHDIKEMMPIIIECNNIIHEIKKEMINNNLNKEMINNNLYNKNLPELLPIVLQLIYEHIDSTIEYNMKYRFIHKKQFHYLNNCFKNINIDLFIENMSHYTKPLIEKLLNFSKHVLANHIMYIMFIINDYDKHSEEDTIKDTIINIYNITQYYQWLYDTISSEEKIEDFKKIGLWTNDKIKIECNLPDNVDKNILDVFKNTQVKFIELWNKHNTINFNIAAGPNSHLFDTDSEDIDNASSFKDDTSNRSSVFLPQTRNNTKIKKNIQFFLSSDSSFISDEPDPS